MTVTKDVTAAECPAKVICDEVTKSNLQSIDCTYNEISVSIVTDDEKLEILADKRYSDAISALIDEV